MIGLSRRKGDDRAGRCRARRPFAALVQFLSGQIAGTGGTVALLAVIIQCRFYQANVASVENSQTRSCGFGRSAIRRSRLAVNSSTPPYGSEARGTDGLAVC